MEISALLRQFAMLQPFDNVRPHRLAVLVQNQNADGRMWRLLDRMWAQPDLTSV